MSDLSYQPYFSIIIPAYNEAERLPHTLQVLWDFLRAQPYTAEIVVVDDGSADETADIARRFGEGRAVRVLTPGHQGKGGAVRSGMLAAAGRCLLMTDADLCTPIEDVAPLMAALEAGADLAIGSRALAGSVLEVRQPFHRQSMGRMGNLAIQLLLLPGIHDTQCGFKLFRRDAARDIFSRTTLQRWSFDIEVLYIARQRGYRMAEVPIRWSHRPGSKLHLVRDYLATLRDLFVIRRRHPVSPAYNPLAAVLQTQGEPTDS